MKNGSLIFSVISTSSKRLQHYLISFQWHLNHVYLPSQPTQKYESFLQKRSTSLAVLKKKFGRFQNFGFGNAAILLSCPETILHDLNVISVVSQVRNIYFLSPLVPSKREKNIQTEITQFVSVCIFFEHRAIYVHFYKRKYFVKGNERGQKTNIPHLSVSSASSMCLLSVCSA